MDKNKNNKQNAARTDRAAQLNVMIKDILFMIPDEIKIPVLAISIQTDTRNDNDFRSYNEKTFVDNILCDENELEENANGAYLIVRIVDQIIYPVYAKWYMIKVEEDFVNGEDGYSIGLCLVGEFEYESFEIEYEYEEEMNMEMPKYIIIKNINKKVS